MPITGKAEPAREKLSTAHSEQTLIDMRSEGNKPKAKTPKPKAEAVKPQDKLIPSCCPLCDYTIQLRVPYPQLREYSYTCPACKTKISVRAGETKDGKTSAIFTVLGILALLVYTLSQWSNIAGLFT